MYPHRRGPIFVRMSCSHLSSISVPLLFQPDMFPGFSFFNVNNGERSLPHGLWNSPNRCSPITAVFYLSCTSRRNHHVRPLSRRHAYTCTHVCILHTDLSQVSDPPVSQCLKSSLAFKGLKGLLWDCCSLIMCQR